MRDRDVRRAVRRRLYAQYGRDPDTRIVEEMGVWSGTVRIDMAVINGELSGIELKSDRDTLERLPFQAELYSRVFDRLELVVGERHAVEAVSIVPDWWQITVATTVDDEIHLVAERAGAINPSPEAYLVAQLLWKNEALSVLKTLGLASGWRSKRVKAIHQRLASEIPFQLLSEHVRAALKRRPQWLGNRAPGHFDMPINSDPDPVL